MESILPQVKLPPNTWLKNGMRVVMAATVVAIASIKPDVASRLVFVFCIKASEFFFEETKKPHGISMRFRTNSVVAPQSVADASIESSIKKFFPTPALSVSGYRVWTSVHLSR